MEIGLVLHELQLTVGGTIWFLVFYCSMANPESTSVSRLGIFNKYLVANLLSKVTQIIVDVWLFWKA